MNTNKQMLGMVAVLLALPATPIFDVSTPEASDFKLLFEKEGVKVFERWHASPDGDEYRELKAEFRVRASHDIIMEALREKKMAARWVQRLEKLEAPSGLKKDEWCFYIRYGLPWPARDHDCVLAYQYSRPEKGFTLVAFKSTERDAYPPLDGVHRILGLSGRWEFRLQEDGSYTVAYYLLTAASSPIPRFILDPLVRSNLLDTMVAFRTVVEGD